MICCLNPQCQQPQNPDGVTFCRNCGTELTPLLRGRYRITQPLGQGGFGRTYLAVDEDRLNTRCVIKQFSPQLQGTKSLEKAMRLFEEEAVRLHELGEHPQIPTLQAYFEHDKRLYLVQQFVEGPTLLQEAQHNGAFDEQRIREVLAGLLPVLKFVHDHQVIHRDITPANIIRRKIDGKLVLIDFGVAKLLTETTSAQPGTRIGTEGYSPMEQIRSGKAYPASDLYSLGATCLYLMTRMKPDDLYDPLNGRWFWREHLEKKGIRFSDRINYILDKMLKDLVNDRYQSASEVMRDLRAALSTPVGATSRTAGAVAAAPPNSRPPSRPPQSTPPSAPRSGNRPGSSRPPLSGGQPQVRPCLHNLAGHSSWIMAVAISPDNQTLISGSMDDTIRIWNLQSGELLNTITGHTKVINCLAISPDGQTLVSGSDDHSIRFWNLPSGKAGRILREHTRDVTSVAISSNGEFLISGSEDRTVRLWRLQNGEPVRMLSGISGMVKAVTVSSDSKIIASGGLDNQIKLWNLQTGQLLRTLTGHFNSVNSVVISPDNKLVASGSKDKTVKIWNLQTGDLLRTFSGHTDAVNSLAISPDGRTLVSGSNDKTVKIWNLETGELLGTLTAHTNPVSTIAISSDGKTLVSGGWDNTIKVWQLSF
jgi:serine/threonine protein kinase